MLVLLSFSVSLWYFNRAHVFASTHACLPGLLWLFARCTWIGVRGRPASGRSVWPIWLLAGATIFVGGFASA